MKVETIKDVLEWTQSFHQNLSRCLSHCSNEATSERSKMLLVYLADHEDHLSALINDIEKTAKTNALNTWCYEYLDRNPIIRHDNCEKPFADLSIDEIILEIENLHQHVIGLYRHLNLHCDTPSASVLLKLLENFERHEAMQINHSANRLHDL